MYARKLLLGETYESSLVKIRGHQFNAEVTATFMDLSAYL